ncbi:hypothetical protein G6F57_012083 [Rhizopus arrhizus]|uniref:CsbD-like domain-containing protein n=1 Tax=Rhizopus oryzae TaxID=64495 RepID=A0A9P6WZX5_RHIOR|nr:hypothetical protein G6F23_008567 [Rhizopus arrhizus]KAG0760336.1 hypothetical protein G6F24_008391 [Rhizopus arrhizus]KAG0784725.1 hypothetical protein G6F21_009727 [Rhizopus arrhizus]KAG0806683.1 hypothetical protein G6F20_010937 [Rhizopus arrhizus]KAG0823045.1 hypothetical protein G6F18_011497 [Rhizopus arrhizus]
MSSTPSRSDAKKDQFVGNVKETVGNAVGNESLENKGHAQNTSGKVQESAANLTGYVQGLVDQASGAVMGAVNSLTGNTTDEAGNKVQEKKGEAQKEFNK